MGRSISVALLAGVAVGGWVTRTALTAIAVDIVGRGGSDVRVSCVTQFVYTLFGGSVVVSTSVLMLFAWTHRYAHGHNFRWPLG